MSLSLEKAIFTKFLLKEEREVEVLTQLFSLKTKLRIFLSFQISTPIWVGNLELSKTFALNGKDLTTFVNRRL